MEFGTTPDKYRAAGSFLLILSDLYASNVGRRAVLLPILRQLLDHRRIRRRMQWQWYMYNQGGAQRDRGVRLVHVVGPKGSVRHKDQSHDLPREHPERSCASSRRVTAYLVMRWRDAPWFIFFLGTHLHKNILSIDSLVRSHKLIQNAPHHTR